MLGSVDISSQSNQSGYKSNKSHVILSFLFKPRKDTSVMFDFAEKAFNKMAFSLYAQKSQC